MELSICETFPSLSPFDVRRERAAEIFLLMRRLSKHNEHKAKKERKTSDGRKIVRRRAGDDWF